MHEISDQITTAENRAISRFEDRRCKDGSIVLPAIEHLQVHANTFFQKADHSLGYLLDIIKLFYGRGAISKAFESLRDLVIKEYGSTDPFSEFLCSVLPCVQLIRNTRNCVEHPRHVQKVETRDFTINPDGTITSPTIEIIHPRTPLPKQPISGVMAEITENVSLIFEVMCAHICSKNLLPFGPFPLTVIALPEESRREPHVRSSIGTYMGGRPVPVS